MKEKVNIKPLPFCIQPSPQVIVACKDPQINKKNALAVSFVANASINEPMLMIGIVPDRYSYGIIKKTGCFTVNFPTKEMSDFYYYIGSVSGKDHDKLAKINTTNCDTIDGFYIDDSPVSLECKVVDSIRPGSHELFIARITAVHCAKNVLSENNEIAWEKISLI